MALYLEILTGEQAGGRFSLRAGMVIGRRNADLTLRDSKVSGKHAVVTTGPDGGLFLADEGSSNGIRVDGSKVRELELLPGVEFQIGRTAIRVVEMDPADAGEIIVEEPKTWQQIVSALAMRGMEQARPPQLEVLVFAPALKLKFIQGVQAGVEWTIGYGPRDIGPSSPDLILNDPGLPPQCFKLIPHTDGVLLRSEGAIEIRLNGQAVEAAFLSEGDELDIRTTRIKVSFLKS